ncbi:hypothetical protein MMC22_009710 [Lobaria immixta]|nr:hypothetical protein [Lobaria immixta]
MSAKSQDGGEIEQSIRSTEDDARASEREKRLRRKIDLRLCTIGALLASMNLIDSGVISSASVTSMLPDLGLDRGSRLSVAILILTVSSVLFQLPATIIGTAFVHTWKQMIVMRILLGIFMSGILPGTALLVSSWYKREEQQLRFAFLQVGQVIVLASGSIVNFCVSDPFQEQFCW